MTDSTEDPHVKLAIHEERISTLQKSDIEQWVHIHQHSSWFQEGKLVLKIMRLGFLFGGFFLVALVIWVRGGWDALFTFLTR
jgi:hypothetical protein